MDIGGRIKALRIAKGVNRAEAAKSAGISYDYWAKIENGWRNPNIAVLRRVLDAIGVTVEGFFGSLESLTPSAHGAPYPIEEWGLTRLGAAKAVPVVGWTQAGEWTSAVGEDQNDKTETVLSDSAPEGCFALAVEGDSMEPEFSAGDVIIVNPALEPKRGDFVVAKIEGDETATFKQYRPKGARVFLHALNPKYKDMTIKDSSGVRIAGVVIESKRLFNAPDRRAQAMAGIIARLTDMSDEELERFKDKL